MTASEELLSVTATMFDDWRDTARRLLIAGIAPETIRWIDGRAKARDGQTDLFGDADTEPVITATGRIAPTEQGRANFRVPKSYLEMARVIASHRSPKRWELLYRVLWRITGGEKHLLQIASDRDVHEATSMRKSVSRDAHKTKAFVRFRKTVDQDGDMYIAWHRPEHYALDQTAEFFARRFDVMRWTIMTPDQTAMWDGKRLTFGPGMLRSEAPTEDQWENLWKTYYANIFNPARIKLKAMQSEMPKKHWPTMPETQLIDQMLRDAPKRVETMLKHAEGGVTAKHFLPAQTRPDLESLCNAAQACEGCELHRSATQVVFGRGPANASLVVIGEQPGDMEDREGVPFVGPAGKLLRQTMVEVGLDATQIYVTNAVKHFKYKKEGKRRLHMKPSSRDVAACRPWLEAELDAIRPAMVLCLGATAASVIFGPSFRITKQRGDVQTTDHARWSMATYHPSALLRVPDPDIKRRMTQMFEDDLRTTAEYLRVLMQV